MIFILATIYIIVFLFIYVIGYFLHYKVSKKFIFYSFLLFALSYGMIAYYIEPPKEWDLSRHFQELNRIRIGGLNYLFNIGIYKEQIGTSLLFYFVSRLPNNHFLPVIAVIIEYVILAYVVSDCCEVNGIDCRYIFLIFIVHFSMNDISWTVSNIRQPLAMSLMALAVYLELLKGKRLGWLLYVVGFAIHPGSVGVIVVRLSLILYKRKIPVQILILIWSGFSSTISSFLRKSDIYWFKYIGDMLYGYVFSENSRSGDSRQVIIKMIFLLTVLFMFWRKRFIWKKDDYGEFYFLTCIFTIGSILSEQIFLRYVLFLSFLTVPIFKQICSNSKKGYLSLSDFSVIGMAAGLMAYQYVVLTSHGVRFWVR